MEDRHVSVDVIYERLRTNRQLVVDRIGHVVLALPWIAIVIYASWKYAFYAFQWNESSPVPGGLPARYAIKFIICVAFVLMLIAVLSKLFHGRKERNR